MEVITRVNSNQMKSVEGANIIGLMENTMMVNGRKIKCMDMEH
jgi:hypothetical protein